jgi:DNA-binding winged helix-turn-helix (wHTH) protein
MLNTHDTSLASEFSFLGFRLDIGKRRLFDPAGNPVNLNSRALDTLQLLVMNRGIPLSKAFLVERVWPDTVVEENNLNQAISCIRKALGDSKYNSRFIQTVTGRGYCFIAELEYPVSRADPKPVAVSAPPDSPETAASLDKTPQIISTTARWLPRSRTARLAAAFLVAGISLIALLQLGARIGINPQDSSAAEASDGAQLASKQVISQPDYEQQILARDQASTASYEAYRYNVAADHAFRRQNFSKAWQLAKKSLSLDADYLGALYNFSKSNAVLAAFPIEDMNSQEHLQLALESAQRYIQLAPGKYEGYVIEALALASLGKWNEAMLNVRKLYEMGAPLWDIQLIAPILMSVGDYKGAIDTLKANLQVEPVNGYSRGYLLAAYEAQGRRMKSRLEYETGEELNPVWWGDTVNVFLSLGRHELSSDTELLPGTTDTIMQMLAHLQRGELEEVRSKLTWVQHNKASTSAEIVYSAAIAAYIGDPELALQFMRMATAKVAVSMHWFWLPVFRETRALPGFSSLLEENGIAGYWREYGMPDFCSLEDYSVSCKKN